MTTRTDWEGWLDDLGPAKVMRVYDPATDMRGIVVVDNVACGPSIGGVRMAPDVSVEEVFRLARAMTLKNAAAGLPHGGGKSGIVANPKTANRKALMRAFARVIRTLEDYIPGPDMGTDEEAMAVVHDEIGRAVGLPRVLGGIPLDEIGATGFGLAQCAEVAARHGGLELKGARVAVEGYGNVGRHAAMFLEELGATLVAASDSRGAIHNPSGIDAAALTRHKHAHGSVASYPEGESIPLEELLTLPCEVLVPAARPDSIREHNAEMIQAKLILQGANIAVTAEAEDVLYRRGVTNVPDFIANAGGVICASVEYHGGAEADAFRQIADKIRRNTEEVLATSVSQSVSPREAALQLARRHVLEAMSYRRHAC